MDDTPESIPARLLRTMGEVARAPIHHAPILLGVALESLIPARLTCTVLLHRCWAQPVPLPGPIDRFWRVIHVSTQDSRLCDPKGFVKQADPAFRDPVLMFLAQAREPSTVWIDAQRAARHPAFHSAGHQETLRDYGLANRLYAVCPLKHEPDWLLCVVVARGEDEAAFVPKELATLELVNQEICSLIAADLREADVGHSWSSERDHLANLTESQRRVLPWLIQGLPEADIAAKIHRSRHTVHDHVKQIYRLLGVTSRVALITRFGGLISRIPIAESQFV